MNSYFDDDVIVLISYDVTTQKNHGQQLLADA